MKISLLFPSDMIRNNQIDSNYKDEFDAAQKASLPVHILDIENIINGAIFPSISENALIIYRGWMLNAESYRALEKRFGNQLLTSSNDYLCAHYLPNWYSILESITIPSVITDEENVIKVFDIFAEKAFIKDYVKSLKTGKGSIVDSSEDIMRVIKDMKYYRGMIEGGIVLRKVVELEPDTETRFFVINNTLFSPTDDCDKYALAAKAVKLLEPKNLKFYSLDIATIRGGENIVIEIGDGQVSDYVGWKLPDFINVLKSLEP